MVCSMTNDKGIFIKNIFYMLSYAFQVLKQTNYETVAAEAFDKVEDLFAAILAKGTAQQVKQGLYRTYMPRQEVLSVLRGKLDMRGTIREKMQRRQKLACEVDELTENNRFNQILKTTMCVLLRSGGVENERKNALKKLLIFFDGVETLNPSAIDWKRLVIQKNNRSYEMLMSICYFVLEGMLQTTEKGEYRMASFSDEHMAKLYERFILEYYRQNHPELDDVRAAQVKWNLTGEQDERMIRFLPMMQTDVMLRYHEKTLIIDAKYYGKTLQHQFDKYSLHSANLYQMFTYVKNQDREHTGNVSGVLLYAKTDEEVTPDCVFHMDGSRIGAKTLDLNRDFQKIAEQLDGLVEEYFIHA